MNRTTLQTYRTCLGRLRRDFSLAYALPDAPFFLFGMGWRRKLLYRAGTLTDVQTGKSVHHWQVTSETIVPPDYTVCLTTTDGEQVTISEDEVAVWLETGAGRTALSHGPVRLPAFAGHPYGPVLRVLHQEVLVNIVDGLPVPNTFVYCRPWYRDAAMMAMVLEWTGNLDLIRDWVLGLEAAYDHNNAGEAEADNPGQALYLISLVSDRSHPLVPAIVAELECLRMDCHIQGRSDFAAHPVYQTRWAKYGLAAMGLPDPFEVPALADTYAPLAWWATAGEHVDDGHRFRGEIAQNYPYLSWAEDHFYGTRCAPVGNRDYPLTWEAHASQADYAGMGAISAEYAQRRLCAPHTWHAAEMFLTLLELG